jgi:fucose permease
MSRADGHGARAVWLYGGYFVTGMVTVILGPLIPELRAAWGVDAAAVAVLFPVQFAVSSLASALSSYHLRGSLMLGYGALTVGLVGLGAGGWTLAVPSMAFVGGGLGLVIPATNLVVARLGSGGRGSALAVVNLVWGLGATACPLLYALLRERGSTDLAPWLLGALTAGVFVLLVMRPGSPAPDEGKSVPAPGDTAEAAVGGSDATAGPPAPGGRRALTALLPAAALLFLYVGSENAVGGWLVELADRLGGERSAVSMLIGSGFWAAVLVGRGVAPWLLRRVSEAALYRLSLATAAAGALTLLLAAGRPLLATGAVVAGLGCAPLFPLTVSLLADATAGAGGRHAGWAFACGGLGGAVLPWLTGLLSAAPTAATVAWNRGFLVPLCGFLLMAVLAAAARSPRDADRHAAG